MYNDMYLPLQYHTECLHCPKKSSVLHLLIHSSTIPHIFWQLLIFLLCPQSRRFTVQFNCSVMSDSLQPHELQHTRLPCPSPMAGACSNSCPLNQQYHPTISSSVIPFSSCLQSFPASQPFLMSQLRIRWPKYWSFSFSIIPSKEIPGLISFRMDWLDLLAVQGTLKSLLQHHSLTVSILWRSALMVQPSHRT